MAVFIDLFAVLSQLRGENVSRFKHRVSRSLSTAFEAWQVLFQKTAALLRRHGPLDVWLDVLNQFVGLGRRHADASTGHPMPRLSRLRPSTAVSWCTRPNGRTRRRRRTAVSRRMEVRLRCHDAMVGRAKRNGFCRREIAPARPGWRSTSNNLMRPTRRSAEVQ
jgi:hypothetical protein